MRTRHDVRRHLRRTRIRMRRRTGDLHIVRLRHFGMTMLWNVHVFPHLQFQSCSKRLTHVVYLVWLCSAGSSRTKCTHSKHASVDALSTFTLLVVQRWESEANQDNWEHTYIYKEGRRPNFFYFCHYNEMQYVHACVFYFRGEMWELWLLLKNRNPTREKAAVTSFLYTFAE